jgi:hypothetical protein
MTLWFHLPCAAYSRPEPFLETQLEAQAAAIADAPLEPLAAAARFGVAHRRVPRLRGAERAASGRAHCRSCREVIGKGEWRLALVFFEEYRFNPGGYIHAYCARNYFETIDLLDRIRHFSPGLRDPDLEEVATVLAAPSPPR